MSITNDDLKIVYKELCDLSIMQMNAIAQDRYNRSMAEPNNHIACKTFIDEIELLQYKVSQLEKKGFINWIKSFLFKGRI